MENNKFESFESPDNIGNKNSPDTNVIASIDNGNKKLNQVAEKLGANAEDKDKAKKGISSGINNLLENVERGEYSSPQVGEALSNLSKLMAMSQNGDLDAKNMLGDVGGSNEQLKKSVGEILNTPTEQLSDIQLV